MALQSPAIDRGSPVPFYFQLARVLQNEITSGLWRAGLPLASESALGERFGVSRSVVRQALDRLERDGSIQRLKGRATLVADSGIRSWRLQSSEGLFHEGVARLGRKVTSKILRSQQGELPRWATDALDLPDDSIGVTIERLRYIDGQPALYTVNHLPAELADTALGLVPEDSLYERLAREHGLVVHGARRVVEAANARDDLAGLLEVARGTPLAFIESASWNDQMRPFDCYQTWLCTDRLRIEVQVVRSSESAPSRSSTRLLPSGLDS